LSQESAADRWLDEWAPEGLEWERLVRTYPLPALAAAAVLGFVLGRRHGATLLAALTSYGASRFQDLVEEELADLTGGAGASGRSTPH
jgi:hypothetical protein